MTNIFKHGFKKVAMGALLAAALPGCVIGGFGGDEQKYSGVNVQNCGRSADPNNNVNILRGREWVVWATKGSAWDSSAVWVPGNPKVISPLPPLDQFGQGPQCGDNPDGTNVSTIDFADLGAAEGDTITLRLIRLATGSANDDYHTLCQQVDLVTGQCLQWCEALVDPGTCSGSAAGAVPDYIEFSFKYSATGIVATRTIEGT